MSATRSADATSTRAMTNVDAFAVAATLAGRASTAGPGDDDDDDDEVPIGDPPDDDEGDDDWDDDDDDDDEEPLQAR